LIAPPLFLFILIELFFVSFGDIKFRKIKNYWSILNIIGSGFLFILFPDMYPFGIESFQFTVVFIIVGFALFMMKIMGGGDSKYLASFFLLVPLGLQEQVFYYLLIWTIVIGIFIFIKNVIHNREQLFQSIKNIDTNGVKSCFGSKFAYAPVILITWVYTGWELYLN